MSTEQQVRAEGAFIVSVVGGMGSRAWQTDPVVVLIALLAIMHELEDAARKALRSNLAGAVQDAWAEMANVLPDVFREDGTLVPGIGSSERAQDGILTLVELFDDMVLSRGECWLAHELPSGAASGEGSYTVVADVPAEETYYDFCEYFNHR